MPTISLTTPTALTVITAGLHATNYAAIQTLLNGGLDNANINAAAGIAFSKMSYPGGATFLRADGTWASVPGTSIGTTLPASPTDGEHAILVDSLTAPTYSWLFRYVSGISDAYKWLCVGGRPVYQEITTQQSTSSTTYAALATAGPSFTLPRAGIYDILIGFDALNAGGTNANRVHYMSYDIGGTGAVDADAVIAAPTNAGQNSSSAERSYRKTFAAAAALVAKYKLPDGAAGAGNFANRRMIVIPFRIS